MTTHSGAHLMSLATVAQPRRKVGAIQDTLRTTKDGIESFHAKDTGEYRNLEVQMSEDLLEMLEI